MNKKPLYISSDFSDRKYITCPCCDGGYLSYRMQINMKTILRIASCIQKNGAIYGSKVRMIIHSGARCPAYNKKLGSKPTSQHYIENWEEDTNAIDFHLEYYQQTVGWCNIPVKIVYQIVECIEDFKNGGVGIYHNWNNPGLHVDCRDKHVRWTVR